MLIGGRYETIRELGRGGSGRTYLAEDTYRRGNPKCVVKKLQPTSKLPSVLEKARMIFDTGVQELYDLGATGATPRLLDHLEQAGEFYLVQELVDGHDLRQTFVLGDRWDEKDVVAQLREILELLVVFHERGIAHQDVKPQNLIRRWKDKKLMLSDVGGIKVIRHLTLTPTGEPKYTTPVGTPGYMPKEQIDGVPTPASDVYAVGMMGIQALTGYTPNQLPRNPATRIVEWHDQAAVSPELMKILDQMVHPDMAERYPTAMAALAALPSPKQRGLSPEELAEFLGEPPPPTYEMVIEPHFSFARDFSEGLAAVMVEDRLGYIDKAGRFIIPPLLEVDPLSLYREGAYQFSEGLSRMAIDHQWGYIDPAGKILIPPQFDGAENFSNGLARVEVEHRYGYINKRGKFAIAPSFESASHAFREEVAAVEIDHKYGYVNRHGAVVIRPQFDSADYFHEGLARITLDGKYGFINKSGELVIPAEFDVAHTFSQQLARVRIDGKYGYIDKTGKTVIAPAFDDTFSFTEGLALVRNENHYGFINPLGHMVIPLRFEDAYPFSEGLAAVKMGNLWGYINPQGEFLVEPQFEDASSFRGGRAAVKKGNGWGYLGVVHP
ncbi:MULTISPECIES: WG repeat-containing protein [unclassified Leptolyngbya]|uniref:WG repeat-containing protein n=1 Tax=unclassified Leptolyngbya TaxID=2650499 RepID=UPI00168307A4|nr:MULTISPECIES: WG repeat-containing protein [unclassified Leptolyngbya]MBD1911183.1 WG repeat-containing protein [Leptolyngbya sp. FACHB-8]MBD2155430.1 WG repeat-containing protein [Leptolyngbya sp. FACHB-16]